MKKANITDAKSCYEYLATESEEKLKFFEFSIVDNICQSCSGEQTIAIYSVTQPFGIVHDDEDTEDKEVEEDVKVEEEITEKVKNKELKDEAIEEKEEAPAATSLILII